MRTLPTNFNRVSDLTEIIFARRNKAYGAYELRKHYNERLLKAFIITASLSLLLILFNSLATYFKSPPIIEDYFPPVWDSIKTFTMEEVKVHETAHREHPVTDQPPTLIINDTASEHKEKHDTVNVQSTGTTSTLNSDTGSQGGNTGNMGIVSESVSSGKNPEPDFTLVPEVPPSFPGGNKAFSKYVQRHFNCGNSSFPGEKTEGKIILRFVVMKDSSIARVEVMRNDVGPDCANQAKNLLLNCPKWNPGLQNNKPVNVMLVLPISVQKEY